MLSTPIRKKNGRDRKNVWDLSGEGRPMREKSGGRFIEIELATYVYSNSSAVRQLGGATVAPHYGPK